MYVIKYLIYFKSIAELWAANNIFLIIIVFITIISSIVSIAVAFCRHVSPPLLCLFYPVLEERTKQ